MREQTDGEFGVMRSIPVEQTRRATMAETHDTST